MGIDIEEAARDIRRGSTTLVMDELARSCGLDVTRADTVTEAETWPRGERWQIRVRRVAIARGA